MRLRPRVVIDMVAISLFICGLLVSLAVFGHDPVNRRNGHNLLGGNGEFIARPLVELFGVAVYAVLGLWLVVVLTLLLTGRRGQWSWRVLGWMLLVPGLALAADCFGDAWLTGPRIGPGGLLGACLHALARGYVTPVGVSLVAGAVIVGGLGLAGDFFWPSFFRSIGKFFRRLGDVWAAQRLNTLEKRATAAANFEPKRKDDIETIPIRHLDALAMSKARPAEGTSNENVPIIKPWEPPLVKHPARLPEQTPVNDYQLPPYDLLEEPEPFPYDAHDQFLRDRAAKLEKTFKDFNLNVRVVGINTGPVITQYEVALETGLRVHKVTCLGDDLALNLKVPSVRLVAPIPGKDTVGVEIPNEHRAVVRLREVILNAGPKLQKSKIPLFLGKDTEGRPLVYDLAEMPHLLIAGRTGTGKSVCMNTIILSVLMTRRPDEVRMIMIDPKMLELSEYGKIPHLMHPVVKDMKKAEAILAWAVDKMEERYDILSRARVRSIAAYNELHPDEIYRRLNPADEDEKARIPERMPYIVIFVDEMNDLMMTMRKEVEGHIIRLAQKSRAAGIHLVVATQKPTVDVITGLIKSNLPARICFQVASRTDSRVVLDEMGAEKLLGKGDMLFLQPGTSTIIRAQGAFAGDAEISRVVEYLECEPAYSRELIQLSTSKGAGRDSGESDFRSRDDLYEQAIEIIVRERRGSCSLLQRAMGIGYGRAARLIDFMAEDGIVGAYNGSNAREVILTPEQWEQMKHGQGATSAA